MRLILFCLLLITSSSFAQMQGPPFSDSIRIDGDRSDWEKIPYVTKNYGNELKSPHVDIVTLQVAMDKKFAYFAVSMKNHGNAKPNDPFFKIAIDTDNMNSTGSADDLRLNGEITLKCIETVINVALE